MLDASGLHLFPSASDIPFLAFARDSLDTWVTVEAGRIADIINREKTTTKPESSQMETVEKIKDNQDIDIFLYEFVRISRTDALAKSFRNFYRPSARS